MFGRSFTDFDGETMGVSGIKMYMVFGHIYSECVIKGKSTVGTEVPVYGQFVLRA